jgi:hypothetical protein
MDSRMKEVCKSNRPAVVRRCSDGKERWRPSFAWRGAGKLDRQGCMPLQGLG